MELSEKVLKWRERHPKCKYCKYYHARFVGVESYEIEACLAKDKTINGLSSLPRWFCNCFELKRG